METAIKKSAKTTKEVISLSVEEISARCFKNLCIYQQIYWLIFK